MLDIVRFREFDSDAHQYCLDALLNGLLRMKAERLRKHIVEAHLPGDREIAPGVAKPILR
jgi:hypothetical protein